MILKSYKKQGVFNLNDHFEEEVLDSELENRKDPKIRVVHQVNVVVIILFIVSLLLLLFSLYYAFIKEKDFVNIRTISDGDIAVIYSNADFGSTITSFINLISEDSSDSYNFIVQNDNEHELNYNILISDVVSSSINKIDKNNLNYSLYKNGIKIKTGNIGQINNNVLVKEVTLASSKDKYELKIWSNISIDKGYKYIIEVSD